MKVRPMVWIRSVLLIGGMVWSAGAPIALANDPAMSNGCVDDTWTATRVDGAPSPRWYHTAVWTDSEMIVWGGRGESGVLNTGGRYDPATDTWTAMSTVNAPSARQEHTAVWTGTEMLVWGGGYYDDGYHAFNTGGRYNPATDTWAAINTDGALSPRIGPTAVWTGTEMLVWGGYDGRVQLNTGGRYNPVTDTWTALSTEGAPSPRSAHVVAWTGTEMLVWGGFSGSFLLNTGGRYNPVTDTWRATGMAGAPSARNRHTAVWTGSEMIVWGGNDGSTTFNTGGRYDPTTDNWAAINTDGTPSARSQHTAVWTDTEMLVWGGASNCPPDGYCNTGGRYDPATDTWRATSTEGAASGRSYHTAVWTGCEMIVWGGFGGPLNSGGRYCARAGREGKPQ